MEAPRERGVDAVAEAPGAKTAATFLMSCQVPREGSAVVGAVPRVLKAVMMGSQATREEGAAVEGAGGTAAAMVRRQAPREEGAVVVGAASLVASAAVREEGAAQRGEGAGARVPQTDRNPPPALLRAANTAAAAAAVADRAV